MISWLDSSNVAYTRMSDREVETTKMNFDNNLSTGLTTPNKDDNRQAYPAPSTDNTVNTRASTLQDLTNPNFYHRDNWFEDMCEILFKLSRRNTTIKAELSGAGYGSRNTVVAVALCSGVGSIFCGLFANLPFVLAPPTVVSIFLSVFLQQTDEGPQEGSIAVVLSGLLLLLIGWKPLGRLAARLIPVAIQVGVAVGIGILTSLAGSTEIDLVEGGEYTIVKMGKITPKICIALSGAILISVATNYHIKGAFCIATIFCSLVWWLYANDWPSSIASVPEVTTINMYEARTDNTALLTVDLIFLYVLYLNGLMTSLSNLAVLTREDDTIPRGRWIFIVCGIFTILSGLVTSAPILVSPESASSIKAGAKTGLSSVVCGILFLLSLFFSPLFEHVPSAGTSPVLIMIGVILYQNVSRIDWRKMSSAAPAFIVLFYVPFTYSIIQGVIIGYVFYLVISLFNGELLVNTADFMKEYVPAVELWLISQFPTLETRNSRESEMGTKHSNTSKKDRAGGTALFDDRTSSVGHIVSGDMAMTSHSFPTTYDSTGHTDFADFGTGQNEGAVNALHQENRNFSI